MFLFGKKGQGEIIVTMVIILLILGSFVLLWNIVNMVVRDSSEEIEIEDFLTRFEIASVDVDGLGGIMLFSQGAVTKKGKNELEEIRKTYKGKMFLKGIMSVDDARMAHDTGFDAIVVSNHGGRVSDYSNGVADILPVIVKEMGRKIEILADGGIRTGFDAFIYLALGAKGVLVGRTSLYGVLGGGTEGVKSVMNKLSSELIRAMLFTECRTIADINIDKITTL